MLPDVLGGPNFMLVTLYAGRFLTLTNLIHLSFTLARILTNWLHAQV